jgi:hypothetical protein
VASGLVVVAVGAVSGCEPVCDPPYRAVAGQTFEQGQPPPTTPWPVGGTERPPVAPVLDTDGDGVADTSEMLDDGHRIVIHRAAGDLELRVPEPGFMVAGDPANLAVGDLDGDGRSEALLNVYGLDNPHPQGRVPYVVPGTTAGGSHDLATVATTPLPGSWVWGIVAAGDLDADGDDDVVSPQFADDPGAPGPDGVGIWWGGDIGSTQTDADDFVAGELQTIVPLDARSALTLITGRPTEPGDTGFELTLWVPEGSMRFTSDGAGTDVYAPLYAQVRVHDDGDQLWLTAEIEYRSVRQRWAWDMDDLCANPAP